MMCLQTAHNQHEEVLNCDKTIYNANGTIYSIVRVQGGAEALPQLCADPILRRSS